MIQNKKGLLLFCLFLLFFSNGIIFSGNNFLSAAEKNLAVQMSKSDKTDAKTSEAVLGVDKKSELIVLDERPANVNEWGYHPLDACESGTNPPSFTWRPMKNISRWDLCVRQGESKETVYQNDQLEFAVHTPPTVFANGNYEWTYRGWTKDGTTTAWSVIRTFTLTENSVSLPLPTKEELLNRIPKSHPRLFVRPETMIEYREQISEGKLLESYTALIKKCERLLQNPPKTNEPPLYPEDMTRNSAEWKKMWWGSRTYTINALENAATLAFVWNLSDRKEFAELAKSILLACAEWNPKGATGYLYNDEAGMPFNYHFARTYTLLHSYLTEEERDICRNVMTIRGKEMFQHLFVKGNHFWSPYSSHSNRAWHFLGEIGIAFYGEIPEATDWVWYSMNVFFAAYPVWSDDDGGWHEGVSYWNSYLNRFSWWADIMQATFNIDAFEKPFFSQVGYYPMYLLPPGRVGGGFGDLANNVSAKSLQPLMNIFANQKKNPYWRWYSDKISKNNSSTTYYDFIRGANANTDAKEPSDLPTSRHFRGTGLVFMNTTLLDAKNDVQLLFKSGGFGTSSHGYDAVNSFLFSAWNENLLINTGYRDKYGSDHHKNWMWSTRSVNAITVDGQGQYPRSGDAQGKILHFETQPLYDIVVGEAASAYPDHLLKRWTRTLVFLKAENMFLVYDQLEASKPSTFEYWLHARNPFQPKDVYFKDSLSKASFALTPNKIWSEDDILSDQLDEKLVPLSDQHQIITRVNEAACSVNMILPEELQFLQTNQYDPNPWASIKIREMHLKMSTPNKQEKMEFLALVHAWKVKEEETVPSPQVQTKTSEEGRTVIIELSDDKKASIFFPAKNETFPTVNFL